MLGKVVQELDYNFSLKLDSGGTNGEFVLCCGGYWVSHLQVIFVVINCCLAVFVK